MRADGMPTPWAQARLDRAAELSGSALLVTLSAGTTHKPPVLTRHGYPIYESVAGASYLIGRGVPADRILTETCSWDTIGNAYFSRTIHADPRRFGRIAVVTSEFHMPRARVIFEWVYGLAPDSRRVDFVTVPDVGIAPEVLQSRREKERQGLSAATALASEVRTLSALNNWLFTAHDAYRPVRLLEVHQPTSRDIGRAHSSY